MFNASPSARPAPISAWNHALFIITAFAFGFLLAPRESHARSADTTPPTLELSSALPATTNEATIRIRGVARDEGTGVEAVEVYSSALGITMSATLDAGGNFVLDLPLVVGDNDIEISALDGADLRSTKTEASVNRLVQAVPALVIDEPAGTGVVYTTEATIDLRGRVWTSLGLGDFSVRMGTTQSVPLAGTTNYTYAFDAVPLKLGVNDLEVAVFSPFGSVRRSVVVERIDPDAMPASATPQIALSVGRDFIAIDAASTGLAGTVSAPECVTNITVNGLAPDQIIPLAANKLSFQVQLSIPSGVTYPVVIEATGCNGQSASRTITYVRDDAAPVITLEAPTMVAGVLPVLENPLRVSGTIDEIGLVGAMLNGLPLSVVPDSVEGRWRFEAGVKLDRGHETQLVIAAWDRAGQRSALVQKVLLENTVELELLTPHEGDQLGLDAGETTIDVSVKVRDAGTTDVVYASIDGGPPVQIGAGEGMHGAPVPISRPVGSGVAQHTLAAWVQSESATLLSRGTAKFGSIDLASVPVALIRQDPPIGAVDVENDAGLTLYFNRQIDSATIEIQVRETVNGVIFRGGPGEGDLRSQSVVERVVLNKTREPVIGRSQNLPGNRAYSFFPATAWNYGATIDVQVLVNGTNVSQSQFTVRKFPTLLHGFVSNELYEPISGIEVFLPELGFQAVSDANGVYNFGWGWPVTKVLPPGVHRAVINPNGKNPRYGIVEGFVEVVANEFNRGPSFVSPWIPATAQFSEISGGARAVLSEGRLILGLEEATLDFNGTGINTGAVAPRITEIASCGYSAELLVGPLFAVRLEPGGVAVSGQMSVDLALPQIGGSFDYLGTLLRMGTERPPLVLFALEPGRSVLWPMDILEVDTVMRRAKTTQVNDRLQRLDVLAVAMVPPTAVPTATKYLKGQATFSDVLAAWYAESPEVVK
jgi:hypothetical protein